MKRISMLLALASVLLLFALPAKADDAHFYGAFGANGAWLTGTDPAWPADLEAAGVLWASPSPHIDAGVDAQYGFSHSYLSGSGWLKVTATDVNDRNFSIYLKVGYRGGSVAAFQPSEFVTGAGFGWVPSPESFPRFLITGDAALGVDSNLATVRIGGRYYFPITF